MTVDNIIKLLDAGFTKEEIHAMNSEPAKEEPAKEEPAKEEPVKEEPAGTNDDLLKLMASKFDELKQSIIESNIRSSNNKTPEQIAPEELLANIVKPIINK